MVFPLFRLRILRIRAFQKFILAIIFTLVLLIIAVDIARTVIIVKGGSVNAVSHAFGVIEPTVAVIVSSLPVYRSLWPTEAQSTHEETDPGQRRLVEPAASIELGQSGKASQSSVEGISGYDEAEQCASRPQLRNGSNIIADRSNSQSLTITVAKE